MRCADTAGEREKVVMGLFENYLLAKTKEPQLDLVTVITHRSFD